MSHHTFTFDLAIVLVVAATTAILARLLRQPSVLGYLFAGLLVGPYIPLPLFADHRRVEAMAEFGVVERSRFWLFGDDTYAAFDRALESAVRRE